MSNQGGDRDATGEEEIIAVVAPTQMQDGHPQIQHQVSLNDERPLELVDSGGGGGEGDAPLEGVNNRRNSTSASSSFNGSIVSTDSSSWLPIPEAICVYHQRGSCLRLNCRFFHGSADQLKNLRETGCSHYRFDQANKVELPKEGDALPESTPEDAALGIRFDDGGRGSGRGRKKPIVCLAYLSGTCRRADCRFTHLPPNVRPLPSTACAYFAVGTCKRNTCRYFHGTEEELARLKNQGATMYNPTTNEPYDKIPDFEEPANNRPLQVGGGTGSGSSSPGQHGGSSLSQPPPYMGGPPPGTQVVVLAPGASPPTGRANFAGSFQQQQQPQFVLASGPNGTAGQFYQQQPNFPQQQQQQFIQTPQGLMMVSPGQQSLQQHQGGGFIQMQQQHFIPQQQQMVSFQPSPGQQQQYQVISQQQPQQPQYLPQQQYTAVSAAQQQLPQFTPQPQ